MRRYYTISFLIGILVLGPVLQLTAQAPISDEWKVESQRDEITPQCWQDDQVRYNGASTLALAGDGRQYADGCWTRTVPVEPNTYYRIRTHFQARNVDEPHRSVFARLLWQDDAGELLGRAEYPRTVRDVQSDGWQLIEQIYQSPPQAAQAKLELVYRWDADGTVYFESATLEEVSEPEPRIVRLGAIHYRPRHDRTLRENLDHFAILIARAAEQEADIVCLPEGITLAGTQKTYVEVSEKVPGPTTEYLGNVAREHSLYIVAGVLEREGAAVYNTAVLLDRDGNLAGKYRKVCLPREEYDGGIAPGKSFQTFDTDFGRIGIMICWDVFFPGPARTLALDGAEVILLPIWGGNLTLARARAIENQVYLVSSTYDMKTGIFDLEGSLMAEGTEENPVAVVEVDLNKKKDWPWLGDFKNRIPRELPPREALWHGSER